MSDRIEIALRRKSLSQNQLAKDVGASQGYVSEVINMQKPGRSLLPTLAERLGVSVEWLITGEDPPEWYQDFMEPTDDQKAGATTINRLGVLRDGKEDELPSDEPHQTVLPSKLDALLARGDGAEPLAKNGQTILLHDASREPRPKDLVYCVTTEGEVLIREFQREPRKGLILLQAPGEPILALDPEEVIALRVIKGILYEED